jgi:uncharacterized protein
MPRTPISKVTVELDGGSGEPVPAVFQTPAGDGRFLAALLLHGFSSRKERMAESIGKSLAEHGVASLAIDLPLHGARPGSFESVSLRNPLALVQNWRLAVRESHAALRFLETNSSIDDRRIGIAGYSLGAFLSVVVAAENETVRAVALAAGGDLPEQTPFASLVRAVADPLRAARRLEGRPLFMINGRHDRTVRPQQARALYDAASEPKELHWYDGGHWPPAHAIERAAKWLAAALSAPSLGIDRVARRQPRRA